MMKKVWLVLLAVVLVFGLALLGCGSKSNDDDDDGGEEQKQGGEAFSFEGPFVYYLWGNDKPTYDGTTGLLTFEDVTSSMGFIIKFSDIGYTYNAKDKLIFTYYVDVEKPAAALLVKGYSGTDNLAEPSNSGGAGYGKGKGWEYVLGHDTLSVHTGPVVDGTWDAATKTGTLEVFMGLFKNTITGLGFQHNPWCDMGGGGKIAEESVYKIKFTKVENGVSDIVIVPPPPPAEGEGFDDTVGMSEGIAAQGSATFADGIIDFTHVGESDYDDGALFTLAVPEATTESTIIIRYICQVEEGSTAKLTLKNGGWGTNLLVENGTDGCNWYPTLTEDVADTLTVKGEWYTDPSTDIWFQRNGDTNAFKLKIISVTVE